MPRIEIVVATDRRGLIGRNGDLPWRLPADLAHFKKTTMGAPILMGRKTWDSIGRPLPGRRNLVMTRDPQFDATGSERITGMSELWSAVAAEERLMIIGGAEIYRLFLPLVDTIHLTEVEAVVGGDTHFPIFSRAAFCESERRHRRADDKNRYAMNFLRYDRRPR